MVDELEQGGDTTQDVDVIDVLSQYGVDDDVLQRVKASTLRHADYTRKTQELSQQREQLLQREAYLAGMAANGGQKQKGNDDPVEQFINNMLENDDSEQSREVAKTLRALTAAQRAAFEKEIEARTAPATAYLKQQQAKEELNEWCAKHLVPNYGKEVMELMTPEVKRYVVGELVANRKVDLVSVLRQVNEDKMDELRSKAKSAKLNTATSRHQEGMTRIVRTGPPANASRRAEPSNGRVAPPDYKQQAAAILRAMGK